MSLEKCVPIIGDTNVHVHVPSFSSVERVAAVVYLIKAAWVLNGLACTEIGDNPAPKLLQCSINSFSIPSIWLQ